MVGSIITFPSFVHTSMFVDKAADPDIFGGRSLSVSNRKNDGKFSVVYNTVNISSISNSQSEDECLFLPFSFYKVIDDKINLEKYEADIELQCFNRNKIIEKSIKNGNRLNDADDLKLYNHTINKTKFKPNSA